MSTYKLVLIGDAEAKEKTKAGIDNELVKFKKLFERFGVKQKVAAIGVTWDLKLDWLDENVGVLHVLNQVPQAVAKVVKMDNDEIVKSLTQCGEVEIYKIQDGEWVSILTGLPQDLKETLVQPAVIEVEKPVEPSVIILPESLEEEKKAFEYDAKVEGEPESLGGGIIKEREAALVIDEIERKEYLKKLPVIGESDLSEDEKPPEEVLLESLCSCGRPLAETTYPIVGSLIYCRDCRLVPELCCCVQKVNEGGD